MFLSLLTIFCINTNYLCDKNIHLEINIRNNINGDYVKVEKLTEIQPGSFVNIKWKDKKLMLPYSPRRGFISFSDLKWDWRYKYNENGKPNENNASLYEIISTNKNIEHKCKNELTKVS